MVSLPHAPSTAAIYVRVSTGGQEQDGTSLETQEAACRRFAEAHGYTVDEAHVYREVHTGGELHGRPRLTAMRAAVRGREVDAAICYALDRLSRKQTHVAIVTDDFEQVDARLLFVTEDFEDGPVGTFIRNAKAFAAELEREKIRERTMRGRRARVESGRPLWGPRLLYGYRFTDGTRSGVAEDPAEAPVVRQVFAWAGAGRSIRAIMRELNDRGVPTSNGGAAWWHSAVHNLLTHPAYAGRAVGLRWVRVKGAGGRGYNVLRPAEDRVELPEGLYPALVSPPGWELVQERLRRNKALAIRNNRTPEATLLRGGYARCGHCGATMTAHPNGAGGKWREYRCAGRSANRGSCVGAKMGAQTLDRAVWDKLGAVIRDPAIIEAELRRLEAEDPTADDLARVERMLGEVSRDRRTQLDNLLKLANPAKTILEAINEKVAALDTRHAELTAERDDILGRRDGWRAARGRLGDLELWCRRVARNFESLGYADRRLLLDALAVQVKVWKYGHEPRWEIAARVPLEGPDAPYSDPTMTDFCSV